MPRIKVLFQFYHNHHSSANRGTSTAQATASNRHSLMLGNRVSEKSQKHDFGRSLFITLNLNAILISFSIVPLITLFPAKRINLNCIRSYLRVRHISAGLKPLRITLPQKISRTRQTTHAELSMHSLRLLYIFQVI